MGTETAGDTPSKRKRPEEAADSPAKRPRVTPGLDSEASEVLSAVTPTAPVKVVEVGEERYRQFMQLLHKCCAEKNQAQPLEMGVIRAFFMKTEKKAPFSDAEIDSCI